MDEVSNALLFVLVIDAFLLISSVGFMEINPATTVVFFNYDGSMIQGFDAGNYTLSQDLSDDLPTGSGTVSVDGGTTWTDTFSSMKNWVLGIPGGKYLYGIVNGVPNLLKLMRLPDEIVFALGFIWHGLTVFLIILKVIK